MKAQDVVDIKGHVWVDAFAGVFLYRAMKGGLTMEDAAFFGVVITNFTVAQGIKFMKGKKDEIRNEGGHRRRSASNRRSVESVQ